MYVYNFNIHYSDHLQEEMLHPNPKIDRTLLHSHQWKFITSLIHDESSWVSHFKPNGYIAGRMEPTDSIPDHFPTWYHDKNTNFSIFLRPDNPLHERAWTRFVHVLGIRHPLVTAMSAWTFQFPGMAMKRSIYDTCLYHNITANGCVELMLRVKADEIPQPTIFDTQQINRIRTQIMGNVFVSYFSPNYNLE